MDLLSDEYDFVDDSDISNVDEVLLRLLSVCKVLGNGLVKYVYCYKLDVVSKDSVIKKFEFVIVGVDVMLEGLILGDKENRVEELEFDDIKIDIKFVMVFFVKDLVLVIVSLILILG